jgi:hypothetical protein
MYNYGLSLTCVSHEIIGGVERNLAWLRTSAVYMLALSSALLSDKLANRNNNDPFHSHTTVFYLQAIVLVHLYPKLTKAGMLGEATACFFFIESHWLVLKTINDSDIAALDTEKLAPAA